ncbi:MAG TPA: SPOR domain-containing protein [Candidatus Omnitrophota bacterium]|nr:SPOR domain-containing protein [Candidatus Omnitrophota bacterium]HPT39339.1 SPOR domain-containing protein [Candidatus Omnitrophota bacterium]
MVEKQDYSQSELFSPVDSSGQYKVRVSKNPFFLRIRGYEKIMLLIMGLVLTSVISFSLGVEKGKRSELIRNSIPDQFGYTIQVATFKNKPLALREAQLLQKEGLTPMVFAKGDYIVLCVGKFSNQESAQPLLIQLQRTYASCRIRRL